jgi:hypothetical protein
MNRHRHGSVARALLGAATVALVGCGSAAPHPEAPAMPASSMAAAEMSAASSTEEALDAIERAEAELQGALDQRTSAPQFAEPPGAPPPSDAASAKPATGEASTMKKNVDAQPTSSPADPCEIACRALASMERAAVHLCGLSGESDPRCEGALTRVKSASGRVEAQCPRCAAR